MEVSTSLTGSKSLSSLRPKMSMMRLWRFVALRLNTSAPLLRSVKLMSL